MKSPTRGNFLDESSPVRRLSSRNGDPATTFGLLLLLVVDAGCGSRDPSPPANLILVTVDTLRADRLGCYGADRPLTPNLDRLAEESILFESVYASLPLTGPNHSAILTGRHPWTTGIRTNGLPLGAEERALPEILQEQGYECAAFVSAWPLKRAIAGLDEGFGVYEDEFLEPQRTAGDTNRLVLAWLAQPHPGPFFLWVHYFDPHAPYLPPERFRARFEVSGGEVERMKSLYEGEVAYVDSEIGILLDALRAEDRLARSIVSVTSDHGESLGEHQYFFDHGDLLFEDQLRVPWILRLPGGAGARREGSPRLSVDILPTLLDALGIPAPEGLEGESALAATPSQDPQAPFQAFFESNQCDGEAQTKTGCWPPGGEGTLHALRFGPWKLVRHPRREGPRYQLFHLARDPGEERDLWGRNPERGESMRATLEAWVEGLPPMVLSPDIDHEALEKLRELGYLR